ncbi:kinase-like domain-containing protein [Mycena filopes]|nr:kinase-like domain-containing protein [Mycena filopes]
MRIGSILYDHKDEQLQLAKDNKDDEQVIEEKNELVENADEGVKNDQLEVDKHDCRGRHDFETWSTPTQDRSSLSSTLTMHGCPFELHVLLEHEQDWVRYQPLLEERGYMLRPRYRPGWVSENLRTGKDWWECEDLFVQIKAGILDATRISDGAQVVLKMFLYKDVEVLASTRAIPLLEVFPFPDDAERSFMVMPCMREATIPPFFETVREFVQFIQQVLEGLVYLHRNNIAHLDICPNNLVVDGIVSSFPGGPHFVFQSLKSDGSGIVWYPNFESRGLVVGGGAEQLGERGDGVPEISDTVPYDPFKVDLWLLGEMLQFDFVLRYSGLDFVVPLMLALLRDDPAQRPDAAEALEMFEQLVRGLTEKRLDQSLPFYRRLPEDEMIRCQAKLRLAGVQFSTHQVLPTRCILRAG